ncbi:hypothetical protein [Streptomyces decoyicus]|uniref:hypothetical protein n=1 Tax=Streptomyces decoyicus TaxID=249567 RepID=UPI003C12C319
MITVIRVIRASVPASPWAAIPDEGYSVAIAASMSVRAARRAGHIAASTEARTMPISDRPMIWAAVKAHVSRALAKLGLANRVQMALLVRDAGLK